MLATQRAFCRAYHETGDAAVAYRRAFRATRLKEDTVKARAAALLAREDIAARLIELDQNRTPRPAAVPAADAGQPGRGGPPVDRQWVLQRLVLNVERALQLVPAKERTNASAGFAYNGAVANRALELIGKELGMFVDQREIRAGPLAGKTDEELNELIRRLLSELKLDHHAP